MSEPGKKIRVMLADSNEAVMGAVKRSLDEDARIEVVGSAATGAETVRKAMVSKPLVLIMDLRFPDMPAAQVIQQLTSTGLPLAVLIVSANATKGAPALDAALKAGAYEFVKRPLSYKDVEQIGRQIRTHVMVGALTKSKQLGFRGAGAASAAGAGGAVGAAPAVPGLASRKIDALYLEVGAGGRAALASLIGAVKGRIKAAVLVRVHEPREAMEALGRELQPSTPTPLYVANRGDYLVPGRIGLMGDQEGDVVLERNLAGFIEFKAGAAEPAPGAPSTRVLLASFGQLYTTGLAAALVLSADADAAPFDALAAGGALALLAAEGDAPAPRDGAAPVSLAQLAELLARL